MKNYNKILLEAISRGINIALDDYEDLEILILKKLKLIDKNLTKEYLDLTEMAVDLGLPSGTWWCKSNLGADCGDTFQSWFGDYFQWGDLEAYESLTAYKFGKDEKSFTKYNIDDLLTELQPEDDAAYLFLHCHNFKFHIPTKDQCEELLKYTNIEWTKCYSDIKHLSGAILTSKINGNHIFIPAQGYIFGGNRPDGIHLTCGITCATLSGVYRNKCNMLIVKDDETLRYVTNAMYRNSGIPIRGVVNPK